MILVPKKTPTCSDYEKQSPPAPPTSKAARAKRSAEIPPDTRHADHVEEFEEIDAATPEKHHVLRTLAQGASP